MDEEIRTENQTILNSGHRPMPTLYAPKNPGLAAVLSFLFPGLGQIYNGQIGKGVLFMVAQAINLLLMAVAIGLALYPLAWVWGMVDAYKSAEKLNAKNFQY